MGKKPCGGRGGGGGGGRKPRLSITVLLASFILSALLWTGVSFGAPFLVCDPYPSTVSQPTEFQLQLDGSPTWIASPAETVPGGVRLHYDLTAITSGAHTVNVKAKNQWGESSAVPFSFTKSTPGGPTGIAIAPN